MFNYIHLFSIIVEENISNVLYYYQVMQAEDKE